MSDTRFWLMVAVFAVVAWLDTRRTVHTPRKAAICRRCLHPLTQHQPGRGCQASGCCCQEEK